MQNVKNYSSWILVDSENKAVLTVRQMAGDLCTAPRIISLFTLSLVTDLTDETLGVSGLWLGTRTGAGGTATLTGSFFGRSPWLHGQQAVLKIFSKNR